MSQDASIERLLEELFEGGVTPEELCQDTPELLPQLAARWQKICRVNEVLDILFPPISEKLPQEPFNCDDLDRDATS